MLSNLLSTVAEGGKILLEEENYLLARVQIDGRAMLAEISRGSSGGFSSDDWPGIDGVLLPDSQMHPGNDTETRILLFSIPDNAELCVETIIREGGFSEEDALETGKKVLDICCASGTNSKILYEKGASVTGVDISKEMINITKKRVPSIIFKVANMKHLPFSDNSFDVLFFGLCIHY